MRIRYYCLGLLLVFALAAIGVSGQYVKATRWQYTWPKVIQYAATTSCNLGNPDQQSDTCYRDGIRQCQLHNSAMCYQNCIRSVQSICFNNFGTTTTKLPTCTVSQSFEKQFSSTSQCSRAAFDFCNKNCVTLAQKKDCTDRAQTRCSRIGRVFI